MKTRYGHEWVRDDQGYIPAAWAVVMSGKKTVNNNYGKPSIYYKDTSIEHYYVRDDIAEAWEWYRNLPRREIMAEVPPTIQKRWEDARQFMTVSVEDVVVSPDMYLTRRQRLARSVLSGMQGGGMSFIPSMVLDKLWLTSSLPMVGLPMVGAAAAAGVGYGVYKTRKRKGSEDTKDTEVVEIPPHQLTEQQIELLQDIYQRAPFLAGDISTLSINDDSMPARFEEATKVIGGKSREIEMQSMLRWIDNNSFYRATDGGIESRDDFGRATEHLAKGAAELYNQPINEAFGIGTTARTPLSLLALVRMRKRGEFMTRYESEFVKMNEMIDGIREKYVRIEEIERTAKVIDSTTGYFYLSVESVRQEAFAMMRGVALMDLRLAALAYSYDTSRTNTEQNYTPLETEAVLNERLDTWQRAIDELCAVSLEGMSDAMGEVLIMALESSRDRINRPGDYGAAARRVVEYVGRISGHVQNQGEATEAMRKINELLR